MTCRTRWLRGSLSIWGPALVLLVACTDIFSPGKSRNRVLWHVDGPGHYAPAVHDTTVFFPTADHRVVALDARTGAPRWSAQDGFAGGPPLGLNAVVAAGIVAVPDEDIYGFDMNNGAPRWDFHPTVGGAPGRFALATDGSAIFSGSPSGYAYAIDATTGRQLWAVAVDTGAIPVNVADPVLDSEVVVLTYERFTAPITGGVIALDRKTGVERWRREFESALPAYGSGGGGFGQSVFWHTAEKDLVCVAAGDGRIYGLERTTGAIAWNTTLPPGQSAGQWRPLVLADDLLVAGSNEGTVTGFDPATGMTRWRVAGFSSLIMPIVSDGNTVYFTDTDLELVAMNATNGKVRWRVGPGQAGRGLIGYPAVDQDRLYVQGIDGFYAIRK